MKYILVVIVLLLSACNKPSAPPPNIAEPQRKALEDAKKVDQVIQQQAAERQKQIDEAGK